MQSLIPHPSLQAVHFIEEDVQHGLKGCKEGLWTTIGSVRSVCFGFGKLKASTMVVTPTKIVV